MQKQKKLRRKQLLKILQKAEDAIKTKEAGVKSAEESVKRLKKV